MQTRTEELAASDDLVYLSPEVKIEPLIMRWYAWPHLMAPVQHSLNIAFRHLPVMQSFVQNPRVHIAATRDPKMFGGPFLSAAEEDVSRIKALLEETKIQCADLIKFGRDFREFAATLLVNAKGFSLLEYYKNVPEMLRGAAELAYNVNNQASVYIIEELLRGGALELRHLEEICLSRVKETDRPFFMSSPRVRREDDLNLGLRFDDERIDLLAKMRTSPQPMGKVVKELGLCEESRGKFERFVTKNSPQSSDTSYEADGVRVRYFCHACVLLQSKGVSILIDPLFSFEKGEQKFTIHDLPDVIDYVVISHGHLDHFCPEMLMQIRHKVKNIIVPANNRGSISDPSLKLVLHRLGYADVTTLVSFEKIQFPGGEILSLPFPGEHSELDIQSKQSIQVSLSGRTFLFLVDSNAIEPQLYTRLASRVGPIDALFMGMECHGAPLSWQYGPLMTQTIVRRDDESRRLDGSDCERATRIVDAIDCKRVFIYAMGHEKWVRFIVGMDFDPNSYQVSESDKFIAVCADRGIPAERLYGHKELVM